MDACTGLVSSQAGGARLSSYCKKLKGATKVERMLFSLCLVSYLSDLACIRGWQRLSNSVGSIFKDVGLIADSLVV